MALKDYYHVLGLAPSATQDEIKRTYRKLARKYHPDLNKATDAEAQFKEVAEAYKALNDVEKRSAYDAAIKHEKNGNQSFSHPPEWGPRSDYNGGRTEDAGAFTRAAFFEDLFASHGQGGYSADSLQAGTDQYARIQIALRDAYLGARRRIVLQVEHADANGHMQMQERQLDVTIPKGIRDGQHLRFAGQGNPGRNQSPAGDLYLEVELAPHPHFRVDGRDVYLVMPVAPWEAALGANVAMPTPDGSVQLTIPAHSQPGRTLRLKGKGIPGAPAGDLYAVLSIVLPPSETAAAQMAWREMSNHFESFNPRQSLGRATHE
ncbi:DnaJ C-terminal domain-containing protein [Silvimonas soli]|uniref:DnaJ C-terminal domain-containing protein n=1 Tax=Silvimonas soli TaxID=2980100 RepID=UPI0024B333C7|nr:DnaJ C-terminal domain-containing protein [Silvimonas soli]